MPQYPDKLIDLDDKEIPQEIKDDVARTIKQEIQPPKPEYIWKKYQDYLALCDRREKKPNMASFCSYLGTYYGKLADWAKKEKLRPIVKRIRTDMLGRKLELAEEGKIRSNVFIFDAVNTLGAVSSKSEDKRKEEHSGTVTLKVERKIVGD